MQIENQTVNRRVFWCLLGILSACFAPALAEELSPEGPLALELLVETGEGSWKPVVLDTYRQAPPGRLLMVSIRFRVPAEPGLAPQLLTLEIPDWLDYQMGSAVGPGSQVLLSFNNGSSFGKDPGARVSPEYAGARASHIRWVFGRRLSPGVLGQVRYRATRRPGTGHAGVSESMNDSVAGQGNSK